MTKKFVALWLLSWLLLTHQALAQTQLEGVRLWASPDRTRVVFDLSGEPQYSLFTLNNPERVVVDLKNTQWNASLDNLVFKDTGITAIRYGQRKQKHLRLVVDLKTAAQPESFTLRPHGQYGHRLVLDLEDKNAHRPQPIPASEPVASISTMLPRDFIIAIDAGHGGEDPGAIGRRYKTHEKEVVLKVAHKLQNLINQQTGMRAFLVRKGDYYVGLRKRIEVARKQGADLFISLHADSFKNTKANGASVFVLSEGGASSEAARWLAEKENRADLIGGISLDDKGDLLASVLLDLSQTANQTASEAFGDAILKSLGRVVSLHHDSLQRAGFAVLKSPDVPSILVELGFLSNREGEAKLRTAKHQDTLARALLSGLKNYLSQKSQPLVPMGSHWFAVKKYKVQRGDTLSEIALQYGVPVERIKEANQIKKDTIHVGQMLTIPIQEGRHG